MRRFFAIAVLIALPLTLWAQTPVLRKAVDTGTAIDESPRLSRVDTGKYAVTWARGLNGNESKLFGRVIDLNGNFASGVKSNILGSTVYRYSSYELLPLSAGGLLLAGTRNSDRQIVTRFFSKTFAPSGGIVPSGVVGYNPSLAGTPNGFLLGNSDGGSLSFWSRLDTQGHKSSAQTLFKGSTPSNGFNLLQIAVLPNGNFLFVGLEKNSADASRAAGYFMPASLATAGALIPYESSFSAESLNVDAAVDTTGGFTLFGHVVNENTTSSKLRPLNTGGHSAGGAKAFPAGFTNQFNRNFRVIALTGTGKFAVSWESPGAGYIYLRIFNTKGAPLGNAVLVSPNQYQFPGGIGDLAWDPEASTIVATWIEYVARTAKTNVWVGAFKVS